MNVKLKYGNIYKDLRIPDRAEVSFLSPASVPPVENLEAAFEKVLPIVLVNPRSHTKSHEVNSSIRVSSCPSWMKLCFQTRIPQSAINTVAIAVSDESRPTPIKELLPLLLKRLYKAFPRLRPERITIVIGAGLHPPLDEKGIRRLVPESVAPGCRVISHDAVNSRMTDLGRTSRNTPVLLNSEFATADLKLVIGNIDPHQFVGFTGGAKGGVIGCGSKKTVAANHGLMFHEKAYVANIAGNPVRADIDEAGRMAGISFVINVVMDASNRVVKLLAGDPVAVYQEGAKTCAAIYGVPIREKFDIAIASCGGHPKDICLYQAQKGLAHAALAVKPGGKILLLAACPQGVGDDVYLEYVSRFPTPQAALEDFKRLGFKMGAHKAYLFGRTLVAYDVAIASDLSPDILSKCHLKACDPQATIERWIAGERLWRHGARRHFPGRPKVAVIPNANTTYFYHG
jgi:nickel-dependent lactate racemase